MNRYSLVALSVMLAYGNCLAEERALAILSPSSVSQELTLINGERLASSRYAAIITPVAESVTLTFEGVNEGVLPAKISLDSVQFSDEQQFIAFLKNVGIKDGYVKQIVDQNKIAGFAHTTQCHGARSECVVASKGVDFVVDYYNQTVRMFVSPELLKQSSGDKSYLRLNGGAGLVNNISGYYYESFGDNEPTYYLRDQGVAGYGAGTLKYNLYRSDSDYQTDDLNYTHALFSGNKITAGKVQTSTQFNSSSLLSILSDIPLTGVRVGNAEELIDKSYGNRVHRYYSPASGTLELIRNGKVIYAIATRAGYGELNLAALPAGNYNAVMQVKSSSGDIISSQNIIINNSGNFSTEFSWHLFSGHSQGGYNEFTDEKRVVVDSGVQIPFNSVTAGYIGGSKVHENSIVSTGLIAKKESLSITGKTGFGSNGFRFYEVNAYMDNLSATYKRVKRESTWDSRRENSDSRNFSLNYNLNVLDNLSLSTGYMYSSSLMPSYTVGDDYNDFFNDKRSRSANKYSNESLFVNAFYNIKNGGFLYFNGSKSIGGNDYSLTLGFNLPLGADIQFNNNTTYTQSRRVSNNSNISYNGKLSENWTNTLSAGAYLSDTKYSSLMYTLSHQSNAMKGTGYIFATDTGSKNASVSAESTQVINADGFFLTRDSWSNTAFITRKKSADYDVSVRNMTDNSTRYFNSGVEIISVPAYSKLSVISDTSSSDLIFTDRRSRVTDIFTLSPGSSVRLNKEIMKSDSVIATIRDSGQEYASTATCISDNCLSVSRLSKGVFKVKYYGSSFDMGVGKEVCRAQDLEQKKYINVTCSVNE